MFSANGRTKRRTETGSKTTSVRRNWKEFSCTICNKRKTLTNVEFGEQVLCDCGNPWLRVTKIKEHAVMANPEEMNGVATVEPDIDLNGYTKLLDTTYPLLSKFREAAPGTYKHSHTLTSMVEGVSLALGLDVGLMKVCATYHDIGKSFNPSYFTENQLDEEDPHKDLDPMISYNIITKHVSDSTIILLNDSDFPRKVIEIISQHHGDTVLKYFFRKSKEKDDSTFRYKTTKPKCIESAVLMICDVIEAMSRSLAQNGKLDPMNVIESTINDLIDDGQLDAVYMKLGDLKKDKGSFRKRNGRYLSKKSSIS